MPTPFCETVQVSTTKDSVVKDLRRTTTPLVHETVVPLQADPVPTPMTLIGLQVRPRRTLRSLRLMPSRPSKAEPAAELAYTIKYR